MSFNVLPFGSTPQPDDRPAAKPAQVAPADARFADVVDLATRRKAECDTSAIPDHVWEEVEAASRLWRELHTQSLEVRFDTPEATSRVVASLCDLETGGVVRALPLRETFGVDDHVPDGPSAA
jgi:hypothetical protein